MDGKAPPRVVAYRLRAPPVYRWVYGKDGKGSTCGDRSHGGRSDTDGGCIRYLFFAYVSHYDGGTGNHGPLVQITTSHNARWSASHRIQLICISADLTMVPRHSKEVLAFSQISCQSVSP